jgi:hypothetical protein
MAEAFDSFEKGKLGMSPFTAAALSNQTVQESMRLMLLIRAYQVTRLLPLPVDCLSTASRACGPQRYERSARRAAARPGSPSKGATGLYPAPRTPPQSPRKLYTNLTALTAALPFSTAPWRQVLGHFAAKLDPLGLGGHAHPQELDPAFYGFKDTDLDRE